MNIKEWFKRYEYSSDDWKTIAGLIYDLSDNFQKSPDQLVTLIEEFTSSPLSKGFQCGSISPILSALGKDYPLVNNNTITTYDYMIKVILPGKRRKLKQKLKFYPKNRELILSLIDLLKAPGLDSIRNFDFFTYWFDKSRQSTKKKQKNLKQIDNETVEEIETPVEDIKIEEFLNNVKTRTDFNETYAFAIPRKINISSIINYCEREKWTLPRFQRYFDWNKEDVKELWESIFKNYYTGSLLLWETGGDPKFSTEAIKGVVTTNKDRNDALILDGQQRLTSIYFGVRAPQITIKGSQSFLFLYFNINSYFKGKENVIEIHTSRFSRQETIRRLIFPIYELENYSEWIQDLKDHLFSELQSNADISRENEREY